MPVFLYEGKILCREKVIFNSVCLESVTLFEMLGFGIEQQVSCLLLSRDYSGQVNVFT